MSFITRCPACSTTFKVVPDQLKISDGWVRCGQCQHIFDATLDLQPWWPGQEEAPQAPPQDALQEPSEAPSAVGAEAEAEIHVEGETVPESSDTHLELEPEFSIGESSGPMPEPEVQGEPAWEAPPQPEWKQEPPLEEPSPVEEAVPSFVRQAERRAFWRKPWVQGGMALVLLGLLLGLAGQAAYHWRDQLASRVPAAKPVLETLCGPLGCEMGAPRQLDDIVIDSSVLLRRSPGRYSFNVVIRNKSSLEAAAPALELTLTDIQDQVLVRRVLLPAEWPKPIDSLPAGAEWSVQFDLALEDLSDQVMTGYRAILFYP